MTQPTVTAIIPVRDGAPYVADALESVLDQTVRPNEVIVVDDGSTDDTAEIVARFASPVRLVRQAKQGLSAALNRGIDEAVGDLLGFCDADDLWTRERLERQLELFAREPGCRIVTGLTQQFVSPGADEATRRLRVDTRPTSAPLTATLLVRAEVFDQVGRFDVTLETATGVDWIARVRSAGLRIGEVDEVVLARRVHGGNLGVVRRGQKHHDLVRTLRAHRRRRVGTDAETPTSAQ
jgi:glycosyltransferase involved in cell wall biosynthesis